MENTNNQPSTSPANPAQEKIARIVSTIVLIGTCVLGALGISIAVVAISRGSNDDAKDILQILFSSILPLFGTWIGTVLAYYFSKENLLAANQTVRHLVDKITSDQKLQTMKATDAMIPIDKLKYVAYPTGFDDSKLNLKTHFLDFITDNKISRVILLDERKSAKYVLHRSTIEGFIAEQYFESSVGGVPANGGANPVAGEPKPAEGGANPAAGEPKPAEGGANPESNGATEASQSSPRTLTFEDMKAKGNASVQAILKDGVKFLNESATLADAKILITNFSVCNDVFITKSGTASEPILGWITDKTIAENSIV